MKFRVWCLSWEETELDAADVEVGPHETSGHFIQLPTIHLDRGGASDAAEAYADYCHDNRDGYECTWPLKFRVRSEDGSVQDFEVERDFVTEFSARPVKP